MANNCYQELIIKGNEQVVGEIYSKLVKDNKLISFSSLIPIPSDYELEKLQLSKSEWCKKWYEVECDFGRYHESEFEDNECHIKFHTRNTPCRQFIYQLSQIYEDIHFSLSFNEPYGGFYGYIECKNAEVLIDNFKELEEKDR